MVNNSNQYNATNSSAAAMFIDAATIAGSAYAPFLTQVGGESRALFSRVYEKACAFSQVPLILNSTGKAQFDSTQVDTYVRRSDSLQFKLAEDDCSWPIAHISSA